MRLAISILIYVAIFFGCSSRGKYISLQPIDINSSEPSVINILFKATDEEKIPVPNIKESQITIYEDGERLIKKDVFMKLKKGVDKPYISKTIIAIDIAKSVSNNEKQYIISTLKNLIENGKVRVDSKNMVMIVAFSEDIFLVQDFTGDRKTLLNSLYKIKDSQGLVSANINGTVARLSGLLYDSENREVKKGFLILITENRDSSAEISINETLRLVENKAIYTIGVGSRVDEDTLKLIGLGGNYILDDYSQLQEPLTSIFSQINNYGNSVYLLQYLSQKRASLRGNSNHILTLKIDGNSNEKENGTLEAQFSSEQFKHIVPYIKIGKIGDIRSGEELILNAESIWVDRTPIYNWRILDPRLASLTINVSDTSQAILNFNRNYVGRTKLLVTDIVNGIDTIFPLLLGIYKDTKFNFQNGEIPKDFKQFGAGWKISKDRGRVSLTNRKVQDNQETSIILKGYFEGSKISFDYKISSEEGCDEMLFFIDGKGFYQSGLVDWSHSEYPISNGEHIFEWRYRKDGSTSKYQDSIWIDNIEIKSF